MPFYLSPSVAQEFSAFDQARFTQFLAELRPLALRQGVKETTFDREVTGLVPDARLRARPNQQSEFQRPIKAYVTGAVTPARVARGQALAKDYADVLNGVEARFGVPREIILAIWGLETDFGRDFGKSDVVRSLATLAFLRPDMAKLRDEVVAALLMIERGLVSRNQMIGSWAGAMGNPQFLPSAYLAHGIRFSGSGPPDIWRSIPDSLASIANFLRASGWRANEPWGTEVTLPQGFDYRPFRQEISAWQKLGVTKRGGGAIKGSGLATLFLPSGAKGPPILLQPNFFVLKAYNFSDAYALAAALLSERIAGRSGISAPWPDEAHPLNQNERVDLQNLLKAKGFYQGESDGRIGPVTREAVHGFQLKSGVHPADALPSRKVLEALRR